MTKKLLLTTAAALAFVSGANAVEYKPYVGGSLNLSLPGDSGANYTNPAFAGLATESDLKTGYGLGVNAGAIINDKFRVEGEISYHEKDVDEVSNLGANLPGTEGGFKVLSFMANGYYDIKTPTKFTPYVGAGVGASYINFEQRVPGVSFHTDDSDVVFSYQLMGGVSYALNEKSDIYGGYRYFGTQDGEYEDTDGDTIEAEYDAHILEVGYRYKF